jgi:hypothetical protein
MGTYQGVPDSASPLARALDRSDAPALQTAIIAGLPSRHATVETYSAGERQLLKVPVDGLSGKIDIVSQIRRILPAEERQFTASLRDIVNHDGGLPGMYQGHFTLPAGSYLLSLLVREQSTGRQFAETISFEVK